MENTTTYDELVIIAANKYPNNEDAQKKYILATIRKMEERKNTRRK